MGLGCCDRAVLAGQLQVYETFLSTPDAALRRLRMQTDRLPPRDGHAYRAPAEDA